MDKSFLNGVTSQSLQTVYALIKESDWVTSLQFTHLTHDEDCLLIQFTNVDGRQMGAEIFEDITNIYLIEYIKTDAAATQNSESWFPYDDNYETRSFVKYILSLPANLSSIKKI